MYEAKREDSLSGKRLAGQGAFVLRGAVMDDDYGLRDAVRSYTLRLFGEVINEISEKDKLDEGGTAHVNGRIIHSKEELIEAMVDRLFEDGLAEFHKQFHEEHGFYPPLPDLSKLLRFEQS
jgi:hypothetical protein